MAVEFEGEVYYDCGSYEGEECEHGVYLYIRRAGFREKKKVD
jgi:hypothetical protein